MSTTPRSTGDYISVPNPVTTSPNDSSDITPPDISSSSSSSSSSSNSSSAATADDHIASAPTPATDSDPVVIDVQLSLLRELHDDLVSVVTKPFSEQILLKPPFSELPREEAGLLNEERATQLSASDRNNAAMLRESIILLFIAAVTTGMSMEWKGDEMSVHWFYQMTDKLSRKLANGEHLAGEDRTVFSRLGSIIYSLASHLVTLVDIKSGYYGKMVNFFAPIIYGAFFTAYLALKVYSSDCVPLILVGRMRLSQEDFKRLLPVIEIETYLRVVPRDTSYCAVYTVGCEVMSLRRNHGICTHASVYPDVPDIYGFWVEAEDKHESKLVFRNLECPGGDECPISCDRVRRVLRYKGDKCGSTKLKKKKAKKSKAMKHKPFDLQEIESRHIVTFKITNTANGDKIIQDEEDSDVDSDDTKDFPEAAKQIDEETGLMIPKDFVQSSVSRGVFGFKRLPMMYLWHLSVIGMTVLMALLAFGVINTNSSNGSAAANNADSNSNGNNTTAVENIVSSGNVTNFIMRGVTYLASNASAIIAVISATSLPAAFGILTWIRECWYPETTYFELLAAKAAVTSFMEACKFKGICPGCFTAAVLRSRIALMLLAFGQYAGLVGASSLEQTAGKICFDCQGSTTCLFRAGMHFIQSFRTFDLERQVKFEAVSDLYQKELPHDCSAWYKHGYYYLAQPNKAFLVREIPNSPYVAMAGYVDILNNKVGRLTYFKEPIVVESHSTPIVDFQYLM